MKIKDIVFTIIGLIIVLSIAAVAGNYNAKTKKIDEFKNFVKDCKGIYDNYFSEKNDEYDKLLLKAEEAIKNKKYSSFDSLEKEFESFINEISTEYTEELTTSVQKLKDLNLSFLDSSISEVEKLINEKKFSAAREAINYIYKKNNDIIVEKKKSNIKEKISKAVNFKSEKYSVFDLFFEDYENDNDYEAYAVVGKMIGEDFEGSIWFANDDIVEKISDKSTKKYSPSIIKNEYNSHFQFPTFGDNNEVSTTLWGVKNDKPEEILETTSGYIFQNKEGDLSFILPTNEVIANIQEPSVWSGNALNTYYLYWENGYKEYEGREISNEDFIKYENGQNVLDEIKKEIERKFPENKSITLENIIYRQNGVININYIINEKDEKLYKKNVLVKVEDNVVSIKDNNISTTTENIVKEILKDGTIDLNGFEGNVLTK